MGTVSNFPSAGGGGLASSTNMFTIPTTAVSEATAFTYTYPFDVVAINPMAISMFLNYTLGQAANNMTSSSAGSCTGGFSVDATGKAAKTGQVSLLYYSGGNGPYGTYFRLKMDANSRVLKIWIENAALGSAVTFARTILCNAVGLTS
ncbi:MAG: hypothetical protein LBN00_09990 [Oscillospiraceae bacterium]|jgi:hypothetical protein|nr:hypothetical protein [Oscillospiraceae bacterium]